MYENGHFHCKNNYNVLLLQLMDYHIILRLGETRV